MAPQPLLPRRHAPQHNTAGASHNAGTANTAFRVVHAVASLTLALLTWRIVARPPGDVASSRCAAAAAECPATCRLHGRCVAGSCVCDEGWTDNLAGQKMRYHYFDNEEPRRGAHSFDATYYMYLLMSRTFPHMRIHNATAPLMPPRARRRHRDEEEEEEEEEENA